MIFLKLSRLTFSLIFAAVCVGSQLQALDPDLTLKVPMRDGTELDTDIYLPTPDSKNLPCIFLRGPAGRQSPTAKVFADFAKKGYAVAIQSSRAAEGSDKKLLPFYSDGWGKQQDGYDSVEWLAKHPLTNGKIGTLGISNMGITQVLMAPTAPSALQCQYIIFAAASLYHHGIYPGGQLLKNQVEGIVSLYGKDPALIRFIADQPRYNKFWEGLNALTVAHQVKVPAVHVGGWYDIFIQGTLDAFVHWQEQGAEGAKGKQKLIIGPWGHSWPLGSKFGDFAVPPESLSPPIALHNPNLWFDHYLKGMPNKIDEAPSVIYYVMGPFDGSSSSGNVWRTAEHWPIPSKPTPFYLNEKALLTESIPPEKETLFIYRHDPNDPVPTLGGRNLFLKAGPVDQRPIEQRDDVVVFTTAALEEDLEITGRVIAQLKVGNLPEDTDVAIRLSDVYPDGKSIIIADAIHRTGVIESKAVDNKSKLIDLDLWSTSIVFAKGHKIRISVAGSNYPRFEKNVNVGNEGVHTHHLYAGGIEPSRLILPVVRKGGKPVVTEIQSSPK